MDEAWVTGSSPFNKFTAYCYDKRRSSLKKMQVSQKWMSFLCLDARLFARFHHSQHSRSGPTSRWCKCGPSVHAISTSLAINLERSHSKEIQPAIMSLADGKAKRAPKNSYQISPRYHLL